MKILIVCLPRTGSTSLMIKMSKDFDLKVIGEPFNDTSDYYIKYNNYNWIQEDQYVIKTIVGHIPKTHIDPVDFYLNFYKIFDRTILLSRRDFTACVESFSYMSYHSNLNGFKCTDSYIYTETPHYDYIHNQLSYYNSLLENLSKKTNIPITYYEDIFDINSNERLRKNPKHNKLF